MKKDEILLELRKAKIILWITWIWILVALILALKDVFTVIEQMIITILALVFQRVAMRGLIWIK